MLWGKRPDMLVHELEPFNAEPPGHVLLDGLLTPREAFYSRNHGRVPATGRRHLAAARRRPRRTAGSVVPGRAAARFTTQTVTATLQCAGNRRAGLVAVRDIPGEAPWRDGATSTAEWTGVRPARRARVTPVPTSADGHVAFEACDVSQDARPPQPYGGSIPLDKARAPEVLLAWAMNGEPLTPSTARRSGSSSPATSARAA